MCVCVCVCVFVCMCVCVCERERERERELCALCLCCVHDVRNEPSFVNVYGQNKDNPSITGYSETRMHPTYVALNEVRRLNWCMVEWCAQNMRRDDSSFTWHQPCNNQVTLSVLLHHFGGY